MDAAELIALAGILVGILLSVIVFIWQSHSQNSRLEAKIDAQGASLRAEIQAVSERVGEFERTNARLEGITEALYQILRRQSHTHESDD